jgi:hypothetical protein
LKNWVLNKNRPLKNCRAIANAVGQLIDAEIEIIITTPGLPVDTEDMTLKDLLDAIAT